MHSRLSPQLFDPVAERIHFAQRRRVANCEHLTDTAGQKFAIAVAMIRIENGLAIQMPRPDGAFRGAAAASAAVCQFLIRWLSYRDLGSTY
jgi:hypothetical protein